MPQQTIDIGSAPNDGTGDPLRTAFDKCNDNFDELYADLAGLVIGTDVQAYSANLDEYAAVNPTAAGLALLDDADAAAQRTTLALGTASTPEFTALGLGNDGSGSYADADDLTVGNLTGHHGITVRAATASRSGLFFADAISGAGQFAGVISYNHSTNRMEFSVNGVGYTATVTFDSAGAIIPGVIELGHATDTTLSRLSAGNLGIEGNLVYRAGGTDVPVTDGGTGASDAATARTNLGVSAYTLIEEFLGNGAAGTKTFSAIPGTYRALMLRWLLRGDDAAASVNLGLQFNGDSSAIYDRQHISGSASTASAAESLAQTSAVIATFPAGGATAGYAGTGELIIPRYAGAVFNKQGFGNHSFQTATSSGATQRRTSTIGWRSTSAITSITVTASAGNFITGSVIELWGIG